jgi:hypothetical protein
LSTPADRAVLFSIDKDQAARYIENK